MKKLEFGKLLSLVALMGSLSLNSALAAPAASSEALEAVASQAIIRSGTGTGSIVRPGAKGSVKPGEVSGAKATGAALSKKLSVQQSDAGLQTEAAKLAGPKTDFSNIRTGQAVESAAPAVENTSPAAANNVGRMSPVERANAVISKLDVMVKEGNLDSVLASEVKIAEANNPGAIARITGPGLLGSCGDMKLIHSKTYFESIVAGAKGHSNAEIAFNVRNSLKQSTGVTDEVAKSNACKLASAPCNLYGKVVAANCQ